MSFLSRRNENRARILSALRTVRPNGEGIKRLRIESSANSVRAIVQFRNPELKSLFLKINTEGCESHSKTTPTPLKPSEMLINQRAFEQVASGPIRVQATIMVDDATGTMVSQVVPGSSLKRLLLAWFPPSRFNPLIIMELAGGALAQWHKLSTLEGRNGTSNDETMWPKEVLSYRDFSAWNILVGPSMDTITL